MIRLFFVILTPAVILAQQRSHNSLPSTSECGILKEDQLYNLQKTVEDNEFPWIAKLLDANNTEICISVLISKQYLLAPASSDDLYNISTIELGNCRKKQHCMVRHELDTFLPHEKYVGNGLRVSHDIGLVRMKNPVTFTEYIQPICLPSADVGRIDYVAQYYTFTGQQLLGGRNTKLAVLIMGLKQCHKLNRILDINDYVLCANSCDNGSQFLIGSILMGVSTKNSEPDHYYLIGLLIGGMNRCSDSTPDIFTRIDRHMDWIVENIARLEGA